MRKNIISLLLGLSLTTPWAEGAGRGGAAVPVLVGGEVELDACGSVGIVSGLRGGQGNFISVRRGPGRSFREVGRLRPGDRVWMCDAREAWVGVVFGRGCGVAAPRAQRKPYNGPCASGWVAERYLRLEAG
jgi:hypothetical protein